MENMTPDALTATATAYATYEALVAACRSGYIPSFRQRKEAELKLGMLLAKAGHRVFWG
jgi:hypothetical protein